MSSLPHSTAQGKEQEKKIKNKKMKICKQIVNKTKTNIFTVICSRPRVVVPTAQLFKTIVIPRVIPNTNT